MTGGAETPGTCPNCGGKLRSGSRFCTSCSTPLTPTAVEQRSAEAGEAPAIELVVERGPAVPPIRTTTPIIIGRSRTAGLILDHAYVSGKHARITLSRTEALLEDLGSTNGTFLNGQAVTEPVTVRPGDRIAIGDYVLLLKRIDET